MNAFICHPSAAVYPTETVSTSLEAIAGWPYCCWRVLAFGRWLSGGGYGDALPSKDDAAAEDRMLALLVPGGEAIAARQKVRGIDFYHFGCDPQVASEARMIVETRHRLKEWGKWASGGEPSLASMFSALFGFGGTDTMEMPAHIQEVDIIVCRAEPVHRGALIQVYTKGGSLRNKALVLGIPTMTLKRRLESAEWYVNSVLDRVVQDSIQRRENAISAPQRVVSVRYFS